MNTDLENVWSQIWRPPDRRPPWAWAEEHVHAIPYSPVPGRFRADNSPWIKEPLEALVDPRVRIVSIIASIQSSKTTVGEIGLCYIIANLPGPTLWLDQTDDDAKDQAESRLGRLFDECPAVTALYPRDRHKIKTVVKHFGNGMTLWVLGGSNKTNLQRRSIRWLIADECWTFPTGHMAEAEARVTAFGWLGKAVYLSQGGEENRHGKRLTIAHCFKDALDELRDLGNEGLVWADCEALERRHHLARGTLIVLDAISADPNFTPTYVERRAFLESMRIPQERFSSGIHDGDLRPLLLTTSHPACAQKELFAVYQGLREANHTLKTPFFEGIVMKRADAPYPIQLRSPTEECRAMIKHRFLT